MRLLLFLFLLPFLSVAQQADSIVVPNGVLYYYTYGTGDPVVILSGGPGVSSKQEDDLALHISKTHRAILFDQRGTGLSHTTPFDSTTINLSTAINDIDLLRQHLHISKLTLTGHSWGAMLAGAYIAAHPDKVEAVLMIGGGELNIELYDDVNDNVDLRFQFSDTVAYYYWSDSINSAREPDKAAYEKRKIRWSTMTCNREKLDMVVAQAAHGTYNEGMHELMWQSLRKEKFNVIDQIAKGYKGRCTILFGWQDPIGLTTLSQYMQAFPKATIRGISKAGHMPGVEQPEAFFKGVDEFLGVGK